MRNIEELQKIKEQPENWEREVFQFARSLACRLTESMKKESFLRVKRRQCLIFSWKSTQLTFPCTGKKRGRQRSSEPCLPRLGGDKQQGL